MILVKYMHRLVTSRTFELQIHSPIMFVTLDWSRVQGSHVRRFYDTSLIFIACVASFF